MDIILTVYLAGYNKLITVIFRMIYRRLPNNRRYRLQIQQCGQKRCYNTTYHTTNIYQIFEKRITPGRDTKKAGEMPAFGSGPSGI